MARSQESALRNGQNACERRLIAALSCVKATNRPERKKAPRIPDAPMRFGRNRGHFRAFRSRPRSLSCVSVTSGAERSGRFPEQRHQIGAPAERTGESERERERRVDDERTPTYGVRLVAVTRPMTLGSNPSRTELKMIRACEYAAEMSLAQIEVNPLPTLTSIDCHIGDGRTLCPIPHPCTPWV